MTKGRVLREYLSKFYGVEVKGMSVASVLRDYFTKKYDYVPKGNSMISILQDCIANDVGGGGDKPTPTPEPVVFFDDEIENIRYDRETGESYADLKKSFSDYKSAFYDDESIRSNIDNIKMRWVENGTEYILDVDTNQGSYNKHITSDSIRLDFVPRISSPDEDYSNTTQFSVVSHTRIISGYEALVPSQVGTKIEFYIEE